MTPEHAADLAARILTAIAIDHDADPQPHDDYCRERVASDLAGLRLHDYHCGNHDACSDARRYADGLKRTARLYGVTE